MKARAGRRWAIVTAISVCFALVIGIGLAATMNKGVGLLPIRKYFNEAHTNAVWDWSNITNRNDSDLKDTADFMYLHQINTVYVDVGMYESVLQNTNPEGRKQQEQKLRESIERYITAMDRRNIKVFAAAGHTDWSKPELQHIPIAIQQFVFDYNRHHKPKFAGIEFDIESYNQTHFADASMTEKGLVLNEFLDLADRLATAQQKYIEETDDKFLELGFAIPYWYDNENGNIKSVAWHEKTGPVLFHVLDRLNSLPRSNVVVMAYRNAAAGNDGMIYHGRTEIEYAQSNAPNVDVLMGVEVNNIEPEKITFYGRTFTEISSEMRQVETEFAGAKAYSGVAINDLAGYQQIGSESASE